MKTHKIFTSMFSLGIFSLSLFAMTLTAKAAGTGSLCSADVTEASTASYVLTHMDQSVSAIACGSDLASKGRMDSDTFTLSYIENVETLDFEITLADPTDIGDLYYGWDYYGQYWTSTAKTKKTLEHYELLGADDGSYERQVTDASTIISFPNDLSVENLSEISSVILTIYTYGNNDIDYTLSLAIDAPEEVEEPLVPTGDLYISEFTYEGGIASLTVGTQGGDIVLADDLSVVAQFYAVDPNDSTSRVFIGRRVLNNSHVDFLTAGTSRTFNTNLYRAGTSYANKMSELIEGKEYKLVVQISIKNLASGEVLTSSYDTDLSDLSNFGRVKSLFVQAGILQ